MGYPGNPVVTGPVSLTSITDTYPTHIDELGQGGLMTVTTLTARNAIPTTRRRFGMFVSVFDDPTPANNTTYRLCNTDLGGTNDTITDNANWVEFSGSGGSISDGDKGDITVSGSGVVWTVDVDINKAWTGTHSFIDTNFSILGSSDATKIAKFEVDGFTTATTRTFTLPNLSGTIPIGTGTATQISYWSGTNQITGSSLFTWDNTNKRLIAGNGTISAGEYNFNFGHDTSIASGWSLTNAESSIIRIEANNSMSTGWFNEVGNGSGGFSGSSTITYGIDVLNFGIGSFAGGVGGKVEFINGNRAGGFVHAMADPRNIDGRKDTAIPYVLANGGSFNISRNTSSQTSGYGALAIDGGILGGVDHHLPLNSFRSVIIGGNTIVAPDAITDTVFLPKVRLGLGTGGSLGTTTTNDNLITRNSSTGELEIRDVSSISNSLYYGSVTNTLTDYTLTATDNNKIQYMTNASPIIIRIPLGLNFGYCAKIFRAPGAGVVTIVPDGSVTYEGVNDTLLLPNQLVEITHVGSNKFLGYGSLETDYVDTHLASKVIPNAPGAGEDGFGLRWNDTLNEWEYFDTNTSGLIFINGLTNTVGTITLGGALIQNTTLSGNYDVQFNFRTEYLRFEEVIDDVNYNQLSLGSSFNVSDEYVRTTYISNSPSSYYSTEKHSVSSNIDANFYIGVNTIGFQGNRITGGDSADLYGQVEISTTGLTLSGRQESTGAISTFFFGTPSTAIYTDAGTGTKYGLRYAAAGYVNDDRSLTDRGWVIAQLAGKTLSTPTVSQDTQSIRWNNTANSWEYFTPGSGSGISDGDKGDIVVSGTGTVWTIDSDVVSFAKMQNINTARVLGRYSASTGDIQELTLDSSIALSGAGVLSVYKNYTIEDVSGTTYNFVEADNGKIKRFTNVSGCTATVPSGLSVGWNTIAYRGSGAGTLTFAISGVTYEGVATTLETEETMASLVIRASNIVVATGALGVIGGGGLADGDKGDITVTASGATWTIDNDAVNFAKMQNIDTSRLLGRTTASSGDIEELTVGAGLTLAAGSLNVTLGTAAQIPYVNAGGTALAYEAGFEYDATNNRLTVSDIRLGNSGVAGSRTIDVASSSTNAGIIFIAKGTGDFSFLTDGILGIQDTSTSQFFGMNPALGTVYSSGIGLSIYASSGLPGDVHGKNLILSGGSAYNTGDNNGGDVLIEVGQKNGAGLDGDLELNSRTGNIILTQTLSTDTSLDVLVRASSGNLRRRDATQWIKGSIVIELYNGGSDLTTGIKDTPVILPYSGTVTGWEIMAYDGSNALVSTSSVVDILSDTFANLPLAGTDSIAGTEKPTLSAASTGSDNTITTWSALTAGNYIQAEIESVGAGVKKIVVVIKTLRS